MCRTGLGRGHFSACSFLGGSSMLKLPGACLAGVMLVLLLSPGPVPAWQPGADDPPAVRAAGEEIPPPLQESAFERYVDLRLLGQALSSQNPGLLCDVALQLAEGERVLL